MDFEHQYPYSQNTQTRVDDILEEVDRQSHKRKYNELEYIRGGGLQSAVERRETLKEDNFKQWAAAYKRHRRIRNPDEFVLTTALVLEHWEEPFDDEEEGVRSIYDLPDSFRYSKIEIGLQCMRDEDSREYANDMPDFIVHGVADDERFVGPDGVQRPYGMSFQEYVVPLLYI